MVGPRGTFLILRLPYVFSQKDKSYPFSPPLAEGRGTTAPRCPLAAGVSGYNHKHGTTGGWGVEH